MTLALRWALPAFIASAILTAAHFYGKGTDAVLLYAIGFVTLVSAVIAAAFVAPKVNTKTRLGNAIGALAALGFVFWLDARANELGFAILVLGSLLFLGTGVGSLIGRGVVHPGHLVLVAYVSSLADIFSVFHENGPSKAVLGSERLLSVLALPWTLPGEMTMEFVPVLGVGDIVMTSLYVAAADRHMLSTRRTLSAFVFAYVIVFLMLVVVQRPIPALPLIGAAFVTMHRKSMSLPKGDRKAAVFGIVISTAIFALLWL